MRGCRRLVSERKDPVADQVPGIHTIIGLTKRVCGVRFKARGSCGVFLIAGGVVFGFGTADEVAVQRELRSE